MDKRARRRKRKNTIREIADMVKTILLVVIAIIAVGFVYVFVTGQFGESDESSKLSVFASIFRKNEEESEEQRESSVFEEIEKIPEVREGFNTDSDGRLYFVKEGVVLKGCWLDYENSLYYIDEQGFVCVSDLVEGAFVYHFSSRGEVTSITSAGQVEQQTSGTDMPGLVKSGSLMVFLDPDNCLGRFQQIQYKKSSVSHALGAEEGTEYSLSGSMQIDAEGYVYWLPYIADPDELEAMIKGNLYRKQPGAQDRQLVARGVTGYHVLTGENDKTVIYYCSQSTMFKCGTESCRPDDTVTGFTEGMTYTLQMSEDAQKLYLVTESGYPVKKETNSFHTGGMEYSLSGEGEILSVSQQDHVAEGDYVYLTVSEDLYGMKSSVLIRQKEEEKEVISSEFTGECSNLYYCSEDQRIYAEYLFMDGRPHIVSMSLEGDVDLLIGGDSEASEIRIFGFDEENVIVKQIQTDGSFSYARIKKAERTPLAVAVEPSPYNVPEETETTSETEVWIGPGQTSGPSGGYGPGSTSGRESSTVYQGPGASETEAVISNGPGMY